MRNGEIHFSLQFLFAIEFHDFHLRQFFKFVIDSIDIVLCVILVCSCCGDLDLPEKFLNFRSKSFW